jgi:hypothetical protein
MKSTAPSDASFRPKRSLMAGILAAQLENTNPQQRKNQETASR